MAEDLLLGQSADIFRIGWG